MRLRGVSAGWLGLVPGLFFAVELVAQTIAFDANFNGTTAYNYTAALYGADITKANLDAGTSVGSWTVNKAPNGANVLSAVTQPQIQPDRALNVTEKCLAFGCFFASGTPTAVDTALLTASLASSLSASDSRPITVSLDYCIQKTDTSGRKTVLTGKDASGKRLFQLVFVNSKLEQRLGYYSSAGSFVTIGSVNDLNAQNGKVWDPTGATTSPTIMKNITVVVGATSYAIALKGTTLASGIAFRDASASGLSTMEFSVTSLFTGGFIDNILVSYAPPQGTLISFF